jgi:hypothetical protein
MEAPAKYRWQPEKRERKEREKGQVENPVGLVRERFFTPRLRLRRWRS